MKYKNNSKWKNVIKINFEAEMILQLQDRNAFSNKGIKNI